MSGPWGNVERIPPVASSRRWTTPRSIREPSRYSNPCGMGSGGMWLRAVLRCRRRLSTGILPAGTQKAVPGGVGRRIL